MFDCWRCFLGFFGFGFNEIFVFGSGGMDDDIVYDIQPKEWERERENRQTREEKWYKQMTMTQQTNDNDDDKKALFNNETTAKS